MAFNLVGNSKSSTNMGDSNTLLWELRLSRGILVCANANQTASWQDGLSLVQVIRHVAKRCTLFLPYGIACWGQRL